MATSADKFEEFRKYATEGPWETVSDENGMLISRRSVPGTSLYTQRGITVINAPVLRVRALIENVEARPKWDSMVAKGEMVRRVNENHVVARFTTEAQWPVAAREFFVEVVAEVEPSGKQTILANTPADHEQQFPVTPDFVRGVAQNSGYIIEPVPGAEPEQTKIIFLTQRLSTSTSPTTPPCLALAFNHLHQNICNSRRQGLDPAHRHLVRRRARQDVPRPLQGDVREPRSQVRTTTPPSFQHVSLCSRHEHSSFPFFLPFTQPSNHNFLGRSGFFLSKFFFSLLCLIFCCCFCSCSCSCSCCLTYLISRSRSNSICLCFCKLGADARECSAGGLLDLAAQHRELLCERGRLSPARTERLLELRLRCTFSLGTLFTV